MRPKRPDHPSHAEQLRGKAEKKLRLGATSPQGPDPALADMRRTIHELQVHQIELQMQNEELNLAQLELASSRDRYIDLYDFSPAGYVTLDVHGKIVEANYRASVLLGENRAELIGAPFIRFIAGDDQATFSRHCRLTVTTGLRQSCEVRLHREADVPCFLHLDSLAIQGQRNGPGQWRTAMLDISDRKRIERELESQRQQLHAVIESAMDAIITVDERHHVVMFNKAAESMFGCSAPVAMGGAGGPVYSRTPSIDSPKASGGLCIDC